MDSLESRDGLWHWRRLGENRWINRVFLAVLILYWIWSIMPSMSPWRLDSLSDRTVLLIPDWTVELGLWVAGLLIFFTGTKLLGSLDAQKPRASLARGRYRLSWVVPILLLSRLAFPYFPRLSANVVYYVIPALMAWSLAGILAVVRNNPVPHRKWLLEWGFVVIIFSLLYWCLGTYFTDSVGEHSGDEGHYLIQARSLNQDLDLDLRNNFEHPEEISRSRVHISPNSRRGKWYSWHTPGLSFLLAPTMGHGVSVRHLVLGIIAGLGIGGVYLLCMQIGVGRSTALTMLLFLGCSAFYGVYASRALPEVLGATLATYGMVSIIGRSRWSGRSIALVVAVVILLPWAHIRFAPLALTIAGCYGIAVVYGPRRWPVKMRDATIFALLSFLGWAAFIIFQLHLFEGGSSYPAKNVLFGNLWGLWHTLASNCGILFAFPVFACTSSACVYLLFKRKHRGYAVCAILFFLSIFLTSCATPWFTGGACMPGRFLLVVSPILMVSLAIVVQSANSGFRALALYLGLFSVCMFVAELLVLKNLGKSFSNPYDIRVVHSMFRGVDNLFDLYNPYQGARLMPAGILYCASLALLFMRNKCDCLQASVLAVLTGTLLFTGDILTDNKIKRHSNRQIASFLGTRALDRAYLIALDRGEQTRDLFQFSNRFASHEKAVIKRVTTQDLGVRSRDGNVSLPHVAPNDWKGRDWRWATLVAPFTTGEGWRAVALNAELNGEVSAQFVIREGSNTRTIRNYSAGSEVEDRLVFYAEGVGDIYILVRMEGGDGEFLCHSLGYTAFSENLLRKANLAIDLAEVKDY